MPVSLTDSAYISLRDGIVTGVFPVGEPLSEQQIAARYGISRATARETLKRLCAEKYLISCPRKGYLINEITDAQSRRLQRVRYQVEAFALREIIRSASDGDIASLEDILAQKPAGGDPYDTVNSRFHLRIATLSASEYVYDTLYSFMGLICRYALTCAAGGDLTRENNSHADIVSALLRRDAPAALRALREDLRLGEDEV